jgi:hypothetical protein
VTGRAADLRECRRPNPADTVSPTRARATFVPGPADTAIYSVDDGHCIADRMASEGVYWTPAHRDAGSRHNGWELLRERLKNVAKPDGPRLFVFNHCRQFVRTVPALPRDEVDMDDVDSRAEDHVGDETRYRLLAKEQAAVAPEVRECRRDERVQNRPF